MKQSTKIVAVVVGLAVVVGAVVAIAMGGNNSPTAKQAMTTSSTAIATNHVTIKDYMFSPAVVKVKVGATVTWTNQDSVSHTVTADTVSANAPSSMDIANGKSYSFTFKTAGTYSYHCFPHPYMHGTVEVTQ